MSEKSKICYYAIQAFFKNQNQWLDFFTLNLFTLKDAKETLLYIKDSFLKDPLSGITKLKVVYREDEPIESTLIFIDKPVEENEDEPVEENENV